VIKNIIDAFIIYFNLDFWTFWGLTAQGFFFLRLIIQWVRSEKEKRTIVPLSFWWLGIIGAIMLIIYAVIRKDIVFLITSILQIVIYTRNYIIAIRAKDTLPVE
jgi:lipid-A-disaccharide synthase-like uncharacterized protein